METVEKINNLQEFCPFVGNLMGNDQFSVLLDHFSEDTKTFATTILRSNLYNSETNLEELKYWINLFCSCRAAEFQAIKFVIKSYKLLEKQSESEQLHYRNILSKIKSSVLVGYKINSLKDSVFVEYKGNIVNLPFYIASNSKTIRSIDTSKNGNSTKLLDQIELNKNPQSAAVFCGKPKDKLLEQIENELKQLQKEQENQERQQKERERQQKERERQQKEREKQKKEREKQLKLEQKEREKQLKLEKRQKEREERAAKEHEIKKARLLELQKIKLETREKEKEKAKNTEKNGIIIKTAVEPMNIAHLYAKLEPTISFQTFRAYLLYSGDSFVDYALIANKSKFKNKENFNFYAGITE